MTQEDKELLLKDLCARLPYRVKGVYILGDTIWSEEPEIIENIDLQKGKIWTNNTVQGYNIEDQYFKPYLLMILLLGLKILRKDTLGNQVRSR